MDKKRKVFGVISVILVSLILILLAVFFSLGFEGTLSISGSAFATTFVGSNILLFFLFFLLLFVFLIWAISLQDLLQ